MSVSERHIKLLWGRAASRCSFPDCKIKLTQDKATASDSFPFGEQAHIVGKEEDSPRGKSPLSTDERNSYFNLILLCPNHHRIIDSDHEDYPIEKLHLIKDQHELWVEQTLSESRNLDKNAQDLIYADLVDDAVKYCHFDRWDSWAGQLMSVYRRCESDFEQDVYEFSKKIFRTIWPGSLLELERAMKTLSQAIEDMINKFTEHVSCEEGKLFEDKFYNIGEWNPKRYDKLFIEYETWGNEVDNLVVEATKAANWVADVVRRDINPMFFATEGKFTITYGPMEDLRTSTVLPEYADEERKGMPYNRKATKRRVK